MVLFFFYNLNKYLFYILENEIYFYFIIIFFKQCNHLKIKRLGLCSTTKHSRIQIYRLKKLIVFRKLYNERIINIK